MPFANGKARPRRLVILPVPFSCAATGIVIPAQPGHKSKCGNPRPPQALAALRNGFHSGIRFVRRLAGETPETGNASSGLHIEMKSAAPKCQTIRYPFI